MSTADDAQRHSAQRTVLALTKKRPSDVNDVSWNKSPVRLGVAHTHARRPTPASAPSPQGAHAHTCQRRPAITHSAVPYMYGSARPISENAAFQLPAVSFSPEWKFTVPEPGSITCAPGTYVPSGSRFSAQQTQRIDAATKMGSDQPTMTTIQCTQTRRCKDTPKRTKYGQKPEPGDSAHSGPVTSDERRATHSRHTERHHHHRHTLGNERRHGSHAATQRTGHTPTPPQMWPLHRCASQRPLIARLSTTRRCHTLVHTEAATTQPCTSRPPHTHHTTLRRAPAPAPSKRTACASHPRQPQSAQCIDMLADVDSAAVTGRRRRPDTVTRTAGCAYL
jgi:hypothetical protein